MKRLVLHIGHSKCASSTLQGYLSRFPVLPLDGAGRGGGKLRYMVAGRKGAILHGQPLARAVERSPVGYVSSRGSLFTDLAATSAAFTAAHRASGPDDIVVLSSEGWCNIGKLSDEVARYIEGLPVPVDVFMLTRPPVDWLNAAWWQWGAWMGVGKDEALARFMGVNFLKSLDQWRRMGRVERAAVHDVSQHPVTAFLTFVGAAAKAPVWNQRLNTASDFDLLRHLLRNQAKYQRGLHTPAVELRLGALVAGDRRPLPFVVSSGLAQEIIHRDKADNQALIALIRSGPFPLQDAVERRYLDPAAYDHLPPSVDPMAEIGTDYSDAFVGRLVETILAQEKALSARKGSGLVTWALRLLGGGPQ